MEILERKKKKNPREWIHQQHIEHRKRTSKLDIEQWKFIKLNNREKLDKEQKNTEPQEIVGWNIHKISKMYVSWVPEEGRKR